MSGKPNTEQITELYKHLLKLNDLRQKRTFHQERIREAEVHLTEVNQGIDEAWKESVRLVTAMDCMEQGNFGWENRIVNLLTGLIDQ